MKIITNPVFQQHDTGDHPESMGRMLAFEDEDPTQIDVNGLDYVHLVHEPQYIEMLRTISTTSSGRLDADTWYGPGSFEAAIHAVGASIMASNSNNFALVRPPGHHAYADHGSGFCIFNNIAVAAENLRRSGKRVLILDFDGHMGDGTAHLFKSTDQVFYWSLHQFPAFPGFGRSSEIGEGIGKGFMVNTPLPPSAGDDVFMHAFRNFLPLMEQFKPDTLAISAGFDAHHRDPLLQLRLTYSTFYEIGRQVAGVCDNLFAVLEGGYNVEDLPKCVYNFIAGINGDAMPFDEMRTVSSRSVWEAYDLDLHDAIGNLSPYWKF